MFGRIQRKVSSKWVGSAMLLVFVGVLFFSLFQMSMGMSMTEDTAGCPFMSHEESLCSMSIIDHFGAWKDAFLAVVPSVSLLALAVSVVLFIAIPGQFSLKILLRTRKYFYARINQVLAFPQRALQELFSAGILNPKLF